MNLLLLFEVKVSNLTKLLSDNGLNDKEKAILENFKVTNGFVQNFKNRHNIKFIKLSGEAGSF